MIFPTVPRSSTFDRYLSRYGRKQIEPMVRFHNSITLLNSIGFCLPKRFYNIGMACSVRDPARVDTSMCRQVPCSTTPDTLFLPPYPGRNPTSGVTPSFEGGLSLLHEALGGTGGRRKNAEALGCERRQVTRSGGAALDPRPASLGWGPRCAGRSLAPLPQTLCFCLRTSSRNPTF